MEATFVITTNKMYDQYAFFHCECTWNVCVNFLHFSLLAINGRIYVQKEKKKKRKEKKGEITRRYSC